MRLGIYKELTCPNLVPLLSRTQNGSYRSEAPSREGVSSLTPIEMVVKGIDRLLERLKDGNKLNLKQVVAIACSGAVS